MPEFVKRVEANYMTSGSGCKNDTCVYIYVHAYILAYVCDIYIYFILNVLVYIMLFFISLQ